MAWLMASPFQWGGSVMPSTPKAGHGVVLALVVSALPGCQNSNSPNAPHEEFRKRPTPATQLSWNQPLDDSRLPETAKANRPVAIGTPPLVWQVNGSAVARIVDGSNGNVLLEAPVNTGDLIVVSEALIRIGETRGTVRGNPDTRYLIYLDQPELNETRRIRRGSLAP